jgi:hypothetical protein
VVGVGVVVVERSGRPGTEIRSASPAAMKPSTLAARKIEV